MWVRTTVGIKRGGLLLLLALGALASVAGTVPQQHIPVIRLAESAAHTVALACGAPVRIPLNYVDYPAPEESKYTLVYQTTNDTGRVGLDYGTGVVWWSVMCNASPCTAYFPVDPGGRYHLSLLVQGEQGQNCYYNADVWDWSLRVGP